jgi:toxin-antitoxin system PIN domain toxin
VKVLDLNVLLYAVNRDSPRHDDARAWLESALSGEETVALPWVVLLGFLRVATNRHVLPHPITIDQAVSVVDGWLAQAPVVALSPGDEHWVILSRLQSEVGSAGNLTTDAHLAALALEHEAELCSTDADFARFPRLRWVNPLARPP